MAVNAVVFSITGAVEHIALERELPEFYRAIIHPALISPWLVDEPQARPCFDKRVYQRLERLPTGWLAYVETPNGGAPWSCYRIVQHFMIERSPTMQLLAAEGRRREQKDAVRRVSAPGTISVELYDSGERFVSDKADPFYGMHRQETWWAVERREGVEARVFPPGSPAGL